MVALRERSKLPLSLAAKQEPPELRLFGMPLKPEAESPCRNALVEWRQ